MKNEKTNLIQIALISILLLIGQFGVLLHAIDHPMHEEQQSCHAFVHAEKSGNGLSPLCLQLPLITHLLLASNETDTTVWLELKPFSYYSRAPPSLS